MPRLSRWFVRSALVALLLGLALVMAVAARRTLGLPVWIAALDPAAIHLLTVGWLTQMVFGVAYWMFPRHSRESPRGSETLGWITWGSLNVGLALRVVAEPLALVGAGIPGLLVASAALQLLAGLAFVRNTWSRVREKP